MALGNVMASRLSHSSAPVSSYLDESSGRDDGESGAQRRDSEAPIGSNLGAATNMAYLPQTLVLCELRHEAFEAFVPSGPPDSGLVSKWRAKDRSASQVHGGQLAAGYFDGSVKIFDIRSPDLLVSATRPHTVVEKVVGIGFNVGLVRERL